jgi:hypothetical protein
VNLRYIRRLEFTYGHTKTDTEKFIYTSVYILTRFWPTLFIRVSLIHMRQIGPVLVCVDICVDERLKTFLKFTLSRAQACVIQLIYIKRHTVLNVLFNVLTSQITV